MRYGIYSLSAPPAHLSTAPPIALSDASAVRTFRQALANPSSVMNFKPEDFSLYQLGTFDVETGTIEPFVPISRLVVGPDGDYRKEVSHESF